MGQNRTLRFKGGSVTHKTGTYGPAHDPWSFTEVIVTRGDKTYVAHAGIGLWITDATTGHKTHFYDDQKSEWEELFRELTGYSVTEWDRFMDRYGHSTWAVLTPEERRVRRQMEEYDAILMSYAR